MSTNKNIDKICIGAILFALLIVVLMCNGEKVGIKSADKTLEYEKRLFDDSRVHSIDIIMDDWDEFIDSALKKKYASCTLVIDGESYPNVAIRTKGSSSLTSVAAQDSPRYSFKIEFDHYKKDISYYGLDKLSLNNIISDNTYMMDYLCYNMMNELGVNAPLCSYANIKVNGKDFGLYLANEGLEDAFLQRNFGKDIGNLYKCEGSEGEDFEAEVEQMKKDMQNWDDMEYEEEDGDPDAYKDMNLEYIDDNPKSYDTFFSHAKTKISEEDKKRLVSAIKKLNEKKELKHAIDIDKVIRYMVVQNFVVNGDSYTGESAHNYYLYEKDGRLQMVPYDYNMSFGTYDAIDDTVSVNTPIHDALQNRPMQNWIFSNKTYIKKYNDCYRTFVKDNHLIEKIQKVNNLIAPYVAKDRTKFCTYEQYQKAVDALSQFCKLRMESIQGQLDGTIPSTTEGQEVNKAALIKVKEPLIINMCTGIVQDYKGV